MRNSIAASLGIALLAGLALAPVSLAQSQTPPQQQPQSQQNPDSPADAAAKSKDAKSSSAPKKVYTNDDLSGSQGQLSVVGSNKGDAKAGKSTATANQTRNEQYWRGRAQALRNQMAGVDRQIAQMTAANQATPPPPSAYTVGAHARADVPLQRLQNRKAQIQAQMDQLEDEARRAGVPPGWLR